MMLKLFLPYMSPKAGEYATKTLYSGQIAEGPKVKEFEEEFGKKFNKKNVVSVNSGTSALEIAYRLAGIEEGDEVITPVLTCTATNIPLARLKANIVWADIHPTEMTISVDDVKRKISRSTKAVIFVHFAGNNHGLIELKQLCQLYGVQLIEDAAQALGSNLWGIGDHTALSLQAIKNLTTGDGGIYLGHAHKYARYLRWFGYDREKKQKMGDTNLFYAGYKFHMNDISASIGLANLEDWDKVWAHKEKINAIYRKYGLFAYTWLAGGFTNDYERLKTKALKSGFEIGQHHYRNDKYTIFGYRKTLPNMDSIEGKYFFVPSHYGVSEEDAHKIGKICKGYLMK
jgi:perosamine synthetase